MKTLDRYIARVLVASFVFALAALLSIFSVINLMQELEEAGSGGYRIGDAIWYVVMTLPAEAYELFPAAALLGGVIGLGGLAARNELTAVWACGISQLRLTRSVLQVGALLMLLGVGLGELVAAPLAQLAAVQRSVSLSGGAALSSGHGFWLRDGLRYINVRAPLRQDELRDLYVYDVDERHRLRQFSHARSASYAEGQWTAFEVVENTIGESGVQSDRHPVQRWGGFITARQLGLLSFPAEFLSVPELRRSIQSLRARGENAHRYELTLWRRVMMPITTAIMIFLALPFILIAGPTARVGSQIAVAALIGIGFQMVNQTFGQFGLVFGLPPLPSAVLPSAVALVVGIWVARGRESY